MSIELALFWILSLPFCKDIHRSAYPQHRGKVVALGALVGAAIGSFGWILWCAQHRMCGIGDGTGEALFALIAQFGIEVVGAIVGALVGFIPHVRRPLVWLWYAGYPLAFLLLFTAGTLIG